MLKIENISKVYTDSVGYKIHLLENITLEVPKKGCSTILAPKGSGKTSLLRIIANLEKETSATIEKTSKKIAYIPSKPSSFPWMNVQSNIEFGLENSKSDVNKIIKLVGLEGYEDHFPHNKSEGFRFRIALGRALANNTDAIVIDEPFNNLNSLTRQEIYLLVRKIIIETDVTIILGTANITEAIFLSDKMFLMKKKPGEIIDEISIDLPTDRQINLLESEKFIKYRNLIEETFKNKLGRLLYNFSV
ncbi:MAG: ATP-binding cassette domain-containing protein [Melioribacteraceae bacterium]